MIPRHETLAGVSSHDFIARVERALAVRPGVEVAADASARRAAILLLFRESSHGDAELLLIKRAEFEGDPWSGHIACPGGRMEPGDRDLAATAIRETLEETGIDVVRDGEILGTLDDLRPRTLALPPIVIRPFVGIVRRDVELTPSDEVADAFWVPVSSLVDEGSWGTSVIHIRGLDRQERAFRYGDHTVWGLTERALRQLLALAV